jgi:hypothetical protein
MLKVKCVIKSYRAGAWFYYTEKYQGPPLADPLRQWDTDLAIASTFDTYPQAELFLKTQKLEKGIYKIEVLHFFE